MGQKPSRIKNLNTEDTYYFVGGPFSQWYPSNFTDENGQDFVTAEQYMMYSKAMLFDDQEIARKILNTESPAEQRALGREIRNFDVDVWNDNALDIVTEGNRLKFSQNPELAHYLKRTGDKLIVEAADYDPVWGVKLGAYDRRIFDQNEWQGTNWLGQALMQTREDLFGSPQRDYSPDVYPIMSKNNTEWLFCDESITLPNADDGQPRLTTLKAIADQYQTRASEILKIMCLDDLDTIPFETVICPSFGKEMVEITPQELYALNEPFFKAHENYAQILRDASQTNEITNDADLENPNP